MDRNYTLADIHRTIVEFSDSGRALAVALVLKAEGSTPRKAGVMAVIEESGRIWGTIGGGKVEAEAQRRAVEACGSKRPVVFEFLLEGADAGDQEPICGGVMRVLIDPTAAKDRAAYAQAADALRQRKRGVLLTIVRASGGNAGFGVPPSGGTPAEAGIPNVEVSVRWFPDGAVPPEISFAGADAIRSCLADETARLFAVGKVGNLSRSTSGERAGANDGLPTCPTPDSEKTNASGEAFVQPVIPKPVLLIVGGGHIGQALARQAALIGFDVTVIDDRAEFTDPALFPEETTTCCGDVAKEVSDFRIAEDTYIVIVTRGHRHDAEALKACIHTPAAYIGMIGSRRKVALLRKDFIESGAATEEEFNRVFAPIGLDIGAVTVPEIATSIAAQLVAVRRRGGSYTRSRFRWKQQAPEKGMGRAE